MKWLNCLPQSASLCLSGCEKVEVLETESAKPLVSIDCREDGLGNHSVGIVLGWIAEMVEENGGMLIVELRGEKRDIEFVFHTGNWSREADEIDYASAEFRKDGILWNENSLSVEGFESVVNVYREVAEIVDSELRIMIADSRLISM